MMKVLEFGNNQLSRDRYAFLYQGLCNSQRLQGPRDLQRLKVEGSVHRKFERIGVPEKDASRFQWVPRSLTCATTLTLTADEIQVLIDYVPANAWSVLAAEGVADAVEWVSLAPEAKLTEA